VKKGSKRQSKKKSKDQEESDVQNLSENQDHFFWAPDSDYDLQTQRKEAYIERPTQILLRDLLKNGKSANIIPTYDPTSGFIYKSVESAFEEEIPQEKAVAFLEHLTRLEILNKSFYDTISACPYCNSTIMTLHYNCPNCKSHDIIKTSLTEHIPCGLITEKERFSAGKCPRCEEEITQDRCRSMGRWYICRGCNERFEHPKLEFLCRKCNRNFTIEESKIVDIPKYSLNLKKKNEIRQNVASLDNIIKLLQELNFTLETPGIAIGPKSGMQYHFSILARRKIQDHETIVAVDHSVDETEVQSHPLILYIHKTSELKVDLPIFIAIPKLNETAKKIAQGYQILLIEGSPESPEAIDQIRRKIEFELAQKSSPSQPEVIGLGEIQEKKRSKLRKKEKSKIKPQLFSTTSSIHKSQKSKGFMKSLKKAIKRTKDSP
jgi:hypothetical protein